MNTEPLVSLRRRSYRGVVDFQLIWEEGGTPQDKAFPTEAEAVTAMAVIEERLRIAEIAGKGLTVNPFGDLKPFITSKDVYFASMQLQPRGLVFRDAIINYVAAVGALKQTEATVVEAAREYAEAVAALKPYDISLDQAIFEWLELKKAAGNRPLSDILRAYQAQIQATPPAAPKPGTGPSKPAR